jgi:hypothetical protein
MGKYSDSIGPNLQAVRSPPSASKKRCPVRAGAGYVLCSVNNEAGLQFLKIALDAKRNGSECETEIQTNGD